MFIVFIFNVLFIHSIAVFHFQYCYTVDMTYGKVKIIDQKPYLWTPKGWKLGITENTHAIMPLRFRPWYSNGYTFFPHVQHGYPTRPAIKIEGKHVA